MNSDKKYKDFYDLFGLPTTADEEEIKNRTKSMIKKFHPDLADDEIAATPKQFKTLNFAKKTLMKPEKREEYDDMGHETYVEEYGEEKVKGFNFESTRSIINSTPKDVDEEDVDELIQNDLNQIHKAKNKRLNRENNKIDNNNNSPKNVNYDKESKDNSMDSVGILIRLGRFLTIGVFKNILLFILFMLLQIITYYLFGILATFFIFFLTLLLILVVRKI